MMQLLSPTAITPRRRRFLTRRTVVPWLFILPVLTLHLAIVSGPAVSALYYSLTEWNGLGPARFIGLENFARILADPQYGTALGNNLRWMVFFMTVPFALALVSAAALAPVKRGAMFFRTALFLPFVLPSVVIANVWRYLLAPDAGIPAALRGLGLPGFDVALLGQSSTALWCAAFVDNWHFWGFLMVLFLTAMQGVPNELYEAVRLDGATKAQEFWYVTIPGIMPTLVFMLVITASWSVLTFDYIWLLTQGGPAGSSQVLSTLVFMSFNHFEAGYAAALGLSMSLLALLILSMFAVLRRRGWEV
jgi:raffinose/stachyose/melibiose transport system permease protein